MTKTDLSSEVAAIATKGAPPITVAGLTVAGVELQDWVYILTIIWLVVQICTTAVKFYKDHIKKRG